MNTILYHHLIGERYFFPDPEPVPEPVVIQTTHDEIFVHHHQVNKEWPTIVHFHGNGETVANYVPAMVKRLEIMGANSLFVEYNGYGGSPGKPSIMGTFDGISFVKNYLDVPDHQIIPYGRSVGSIFAIEWIYRFPRSGGLIIDSGISDVRERLLMRLRPEELGLAAEEFDTVCQRFLNHKRKLSVYERPVLILHTQHDSLVPVANAEQLLQWCASGQSRLVRFVEGDHNTIFYYNEKEYCQELGDYIQRIKGVY